jgi:hypothetical protein
VGGAGVTVTVGAGVAGAVTVTVGAGGVGGASSAHESANMLTISNANPIAINFRIDFYLLHGKLSKAELSFV